MNGKIGLEEHFAIRETLQDSAGFLPNDSWKELSKRLLDIQDERLRQMDKNGMEMMILSLNSPAVQAIPDPRKALEIAIRANDELAEQVAHAAERGLLRCTAVRSVLGGGGTTGCAFLPASQEPYFELGTDLRWTPVAYGADLGVRSGDGCPRLAANGLRRVRPLPRFEDHFGPYGGGSAL